MTPVMDATEVLSLVPPVPESIEDLGISSSAIEQLVLKHLYFHGELLGREMAHNLGLQFSLIDPVLENLKRQHHVGLKKSMGMGNASGVFALTESGRNLTREGLENNQYAGPVPVPLEQYSEFVRKQRLAENWLTEEALDRAFKHLVVADDILEQLGPAVNSNKSFLIYGQPGNGKTALAESFLNLESAPIYMPYAIECQGNIVQLYDPIYHKKIEPAEASKSAVANVTEFDGRWFKCRRPFIITGGELTLDMLDLSYNKVSKVYDAPFQLKANNGIYLIDDFGRQRATPAEVLNRWIVPMERRVDYLTFQTGGKMTVPFEAFLVFSTNLRPDQLGDEAFLRRIQYKMFLRSPDAQEFIHIFRRFAESRGLECPAGLAEGFVQKHYVDGSKRLRRCHPRDVISHAIDVIHFKRLPLTLTEKLLDRAFRSCFVESAEMID
ncbi:MAG: ATPase-like protein [Bryobacterales bacterium]|nr:ATPase-like protein [Bryobacterales bacterium]